MAQYTKKNKLNVHLHHPPIEFDENRKIRKKLNELMKWI